MKVNININRKKKIYDNKDNNIDCNNLENWVIPKKGVNSNLFLSLLNQKEAQKYNQWLKW